MFDRLLNDFQHGFRSGSFSLLKRSLVSSKLLAIFYGCTRKSIEWKKFRKIFCNIFFVITEHDLIGSLLSVGVLRFHPVCLSVCLSVCLFIIFLRNRLLNFLIFGMMLGVNFQKLIELDFWWKFIIWSYLDTRGQKWRKMRFRNFDKKCLFVFLKVVEKERLWCYLFPNSNPLSGKILFLSYCPKTLI